jgi:hypothetical protein
VPLGGESRAVRRSSGLARPAVIALINRGAGTVRRHVSLASAAAWHAPKLPFSFLAPGEIGMIRILRNFSPFSEFSRFFLTSQKKNEDSPRASGKKTAGTNLGESARISEKRLPEQTSVGESARIFFVFFCGGVENREISRLLGGEVSGGCFLRSEKTP